MCSILIYARLQTVLLSFPGNIFVSARFCFPVSFTPFIGLFITHVLVHLHTSVCLATGWQFFYRVFQCFPSNQKTVFSAFLRFSETRRVTLSVCTPQVCFWQPENGVFFFCRLYKRCVMFISVFLMTKLQFCVNLVVFVIRATRGRF